MGHRPRRRAAEALLRAEVATYDQWGRGEVVGYIAEHWKPCPAGAAWVHTCAGGDWVEADACWGIYGITAAIEQGTTAVAG